jgi:hypothetical protein
MPSAYNLHPESCYSCLSPKLHHKLGLVLAFIAFGSIAAASGVVLQMAGHEPDSNGSSAIAAAPLDPGTHPTSLAAPASPVVSAPQVLTSTPAQAAGVAARTVAAPEPAPLTAPDPAPLAVPEPAQFAAPEPAVSAEPVTSAATESPSPPVAVAKKSKNRAARSQSRRDRGWYDAYAWSPRADYRRGRGYGHDFARPTW